MTTMKIAYDVTLKRPACALLQAALGGTPGIESAFESDDWLIAPTPDMRLYEVTPERLSRLIAITEREAVHEA